MTSVAGRRAAMVSRGPSLLAVALTAMACLAVFVLVRTVLGAGQGAGQVSWQGGVALVCAVVAAEPLRRWITPRLHELVDEHHEPYEVVRSLSSDEPARASAARAIARATNLPWVEVSTDRLDSFGRPVPGAGTVEVPIAFGAEQLGVVRAGERRRGTHLSAADHQVLRELATQLAVRLLAERTIAQLGATRTELVTAREEERRRIRRDLHDGLAPSLASVQLQLKALQRRLPDGDPLRATVEEMIGDVRHASGDLRRLVYELRPPLLDELGLAGALERQFETVERPTVTVTVSTTDLPAAVEVAVFRIATEAVHNAVRHSGATHVDVEVLAEPGSVRLTVEDDGSGFPDPVLPGVGLGAMKERAEELGGSLTVVSGAGLATQVVATIGLVP